MSYGFPINNNHKQAVREALGLSSHSGPSKTHEKANFVAINLIPKNDSVSKRWNYVRGIHQPVKKS